MILDAMKHVIRMSHNRDLLNSGSKNIPDLKYLRSFRLIHRKVFNFIYINFKNFCFI